MSTQAEREQHVAQMRANFRLEGLEPTEADKQLQEAYIAGTATLDQMLDHAHFFAAKTAYTEFRIQETKAGIDPAKIMAEVRARMWCHRIAELIVLADDGEAAKSHLAAGRPIYYCEDAYPDEMVRKWPDGRRELVKVTEAADIRSIRPYPE